MPRRQIGIKLDEQLIERLDAHAAEQAMTRTALVEQLVERGMGSPAPEVRPKPLARVLVEERIIEDVSPDEEATDLTNGQRPSAVEVFTGQVCPSCRRGTINAHHRCQECKEQFA